MPIQLRLLQTLLFLFAAVPCGIPFRWNPNPVFPSELAAFVLCVLITLTCAFIPSDHKDKINPPWTSLFWLAFASFIGIQAAIIQPYYATEVVYPVVYALGAGMLAWSLSRAMAVYGSQSIVTMFAWGLLAGAIFNSGLAVPQIMQLVQEGPRLIFGNIGQKKYVWALSGLGPCERGIFSHAKRRAAKVDVLDCCTVVGVVIGILWLTFAIFVRRCMATGGFILVVARWRDRSSIW
ncbi:hypothetical protein [Deefgea sp. CFH1-16]|uniref:hypothetical protein n=1 Tax=Deefgea sp. CFH1-16 TaxID=2675457 RepID=UPI001FFC7550|nr:hypothetical protein [Deefgea sp. CFH1-16]